MIGFLTCFTKYQDVPLRISKATTIFVEPARTDGQVDYVKAFQQHCHTGDLTSEQNGFRLLIQNIDIAREVSPDQLKSVCRQLGLKTPDDSSLLQYTDPRDFSSEYALANKIDEELIEKLKIELGVQGSPGPSGFGYSTRELLLMRASRPWDAEDLPMFEEWVERNSPALDIYAQAVRYPIFEAPLVWVDYETELYNLQHLGFFRQAARGFLVRANYHLALGDFRLAIDDIVSCKRLGRHCRNFNIYMMVEMGVEIEALADSIGLAYPGRFTVPIDDLEYWASEYSALPAASDMSRIVLLSKLELIEHLREISLDKEHPFLDVSVKMKELRELGLNWNVVSIELQRLFDEYLGEYDVSKKEFTTINSLEYLFRSARSKKFARFVAKFTNSVKEGMEANLRASCSQNLKRITLAMLRYEAEHGHLPPAFTTNADGKPMHSWRVLLLPYLGEEKLHARIRLDEPWNSPHNLTIAAKAPLVYSCPSCSECQADQTTYAVILGKQLPFSGDQGVPLNQFGPASDDMILVIERSEPIGWMDPTKEIPRLEGLRGINEPRDKTGRDVLIGSPHPGGVLVGFRNGSVNFIDENLEQGALVDIIDGTNPIYLPE